MQKLKTPFTSQYLEQVKVKVKWMFGTERTVGWKNIFKEARPRI